MESMKEILEMFTIEDEKKEILKTVRNEERTEETEKIGNLEQRIKVYAKWKELCTEITELDKEDVKNFMDFLETAAKAQRVMCTFAEFLDNDDVENARNMIKDTQITRNELAKSAINFLKV